MVNNYRGLCNLRTIEERRERGEDGAAPRGLAPLGLGCANVSDRTGGHAALRGRRAAWAAGVERSPLAPGHLGKKEEETKGPGRRGRAYFSV